MAVSKLTLVASDYFEGYFYKILAGLFAGAGLFAALEATYWLAFLLILIALVILTTQYKLSIDAENRTYVEYLWILGAKNGERQSFQHLNEVYVKPERYAQRIHSFSNDKVIRFTVYAVYIRVDHDNQLFAGESKNKEKAVERAQQIADRLGIQSRILA